jgi:hypothetical protein
VAFTMKFKKRNAEQAVLPLRIEHQYTDTVGYGRTIGFGVLEAAGAYDKKEDAITAGVVIHSVKPIDSWVRVVSMFVFSSLHSS